MNPMSRRTGVVDWLEKLLPDVESKAWQAACVQLSRYLQSCHENASLSHCMGILAGANLTLYNGLVTPSKSDYNSIHFLRLLFRIKGLHVVMDSKEWDILRVMGCGAEGGAIKWRVYDFSSARDVCEAIGCVLSDLACYLCLVACKDWCKSRRGSADPA